MSLRSITWPQVAVLVACLGVTFAAYKFLGPEAAGVSAVVATVINFLLGRDPPTPPPSGDGPALRALPGGLAAVFLCFVLVASTTSCQDAKSAADEIETVGAKLAKCRGEARTAYYVDHKSEPEAWAVYEGCKRREGVQ
jgi:hypothetical protein